MAKKIYVGVETAAQKVKKVYIGVQTEPIFNQPALTANGTLGIDKFAVSVNNAHNDYPIFKAFSSGSNDFYSSNANPSTGTINIVFYNPVPIKVTKLSFKNVPTGFASSSPKEFSVHGSNDNASWTTIGSYTNSNNTLAASWAVNLMNNSFYKYYRIVITSANTTQAYVNIGKITITAEQQVLTVARKVKSAYIGVDGIARKIFSGTDPSTMVIEYTGKYSRELVTMNDGKQYVLLTLTSSGTLTLENESAVDVWLCGGGDNGGGSAYDRCGKGGDGSRFHQINAVKIKTATVVVGAGNRGDSAFNGITNKYVQGAYGGGPAASSQYGIGGGKADKPTVPFNDNFFKQLPCAGGAGGSYKRERSAIGSVIYPGGGGGSSSADGNNGQSFQEMALGGETGGGNSNNPSSSTDSAGGQNATYYGSGGGGAGIVSHITSSISGNGGFGYQGVVFVRIPIEQ